MHVSIRTITSLEITHSDYNDPVVLSQETWIKTKRLIAIVGYHANMEHGCGYPKVECIKLLRDMTGLGLKEAKVAVEAAWYDRGNT